MISGAKASFELSFKMLAIYCVWLSLLEILTRTNFDKKINKLFKPITKRLFKGESDECLSYINLNFTANLLGIGGVATPMGIKAINSMNKFNNKASDNMILFIVINTTSIQLLPASIIGLRASFGSISSSDIILPTLIASTISTIIGFLLCKGFATPKCKKNTLPLNKNFNGKLYE